jgi:hypothetical protein
MAEFELNVDRRAFANRGVEVHFDEARYGDLLDALVNNVPTDEIPRVNIGPAPVWGMPARLKFLHSAARNDEIYASAEYIPATKSMDIHADTGLDRVNKGLLHATRWWSSDLNGELEDHRADILDSRDGRRISIGCHVAAGGFLGLDIAHESGVVLGSVLGLMAGLTVEIVNAENSPLKRKVRNFVKDPEVLANYGRIITYAALR